METRLATLNDIEPLCRLCSEFFAYNAGLQPEYCRAAKEDGRYPESVITSTGADILLAEQGGVIVGFIHIKEAATPTFESVVPHRYAEIVGFMVASAHRNKGIGKELLEAAKGWSKARSLDYLELMVLSNAQDAIRFYRQGGFDVAAHIMRCPL